MHSFITVDSQGVQSVAFRRAARELCCQYLHPFSRPVVMSHSVLGSKVNRTDFPTQVCLQNLDSCSFQLKDLGLTRESIKNDVLLTDE